MTGELVYQCEARDISRMPLQLTSPNIQDQPSTIQELKDQWASKLLLTYVQNLQLSEYPLRKTDQDLYRTD